MNAISARSWSRAQNIRRDGFKDGLIMLRYDSEVWLEA